MANRRHQGHPISEAIIQGVYRDRPLWGLEELQWLSQEYGIDLKITAFERDIEIVQGFIVLDSTKKYQDYEWMCPCPTMGG